MNKFKSTSDNVCTTEKIRQSMYIRCLIAYCIGIFIASTVEFTLIAISNPLTSGHPSGILLFMILLCSALPAILTAWVPMIFGIRIYPNRSPWWGILFGIGAIASSVIVFYIYSYVNKRIFTIMFFITLSLAGFILSETINYAIYLIKHEK